VAIGLVIFQRMGERPDDNVEGAAGTGSESAVPGLTQSGSGNADSTAAALPANVEIGDGQVRVYTIDAAQSEVYWRIYRSGTFARLGHNHVISISELDGSVSLGNDLAAAEWNLRFPVEGLIIDDPALRERYGEDFESVPSEEDKAGTKTNMMTDRVLNGEVYTEISLTGTGVKGSLANAQLPVTIQMLGRSIEQSFPASITLDADALTVEGEYRLTHQDLGMEPFSAFAGAIAVGDEIDFTYRIHAVAGGR
jgi:hypothetical protein